MPEHSNLADIIKRVKKFRRRELLGAINRLAVALDDEPARAKVLKWPGRIGRWSYSQQIVIATHSLAALTKVVLAHGNQWASQVPTAKDLIFLQNQVAHLPSYFTTKPLGSMSPEELFLQMAYQQFPFQAKNEWRNLGRTLALYRTVPKILASEGKELPVNLDAAARDIYGMTLSQFIWCGFFVFGHSLNSKSPHMNIPGSADYVSKIKESWKGDLQDAPTEETFQRFLALVSKDLDEYKVAIGDLRNQDERIINVDYMPLPKYPIVRIGPGEAVVPVPKPLIERITSGIFHDFSNYFQGGGPENRFRECFGRLFERYVGLQLALAFPEHDLYPECDYGHDGRKTPDWVVNDADRALAIECRSGTLSLPTRIHARPEDISTDLSRVAVEALVKAVQKLEDLKAGKTHISLRCHAEALLCLCTLEDAQPLGLFGALLQKETTRQLTADSPPIHLMPISILENMCAFQNEDVFLRALPALKIDERWFNYHDEGPEKRWRDLLPGDPPRNPLIDQASLTFLSAMPPDGRS